MNHLGYGKTREKKSGEDFRFGFSNRKRSEPDLTTQAFAEAIGTLLFLTPTIQNQLLLVFKHA